MPRTKGADLITEYLIANKIPYVFGICGHGNVGMLDSLHAARDRIKLVSPRHEQVAAHMADAYFRVRPRPDEVRSQDVPIKLLHQDATVRLRCADCPTLDGAQISRNHDAVFGAGNQRAGPSRSGRASGDKPFNDAKEGPRAPIDVAGHSKPGPRIVGNAAAK